MAFYMVHSYQRKILCKRNRLGLRHADQQCANQTGAIGNPDGIDIIQCNVCSGKCQADNLIYPFDMLSGSYLRNYTAVQCMNVNLR